MKNIKKYILLLLFAIVFNVSYADNKDNTNIEKTKQEIKKEYKTDIIDEKNIDWDRKIKLKGQLLLKNGEAYNGMYVALYNQVTGEDLCSEYSHKEFLEKDHLGIYETGYNGMIDLDCNLTLRDLLKYKDYIYVYLSKPAYNLMESPGIKIPLNLKSEIDRYRLTLWDLKTSNFPVLLDINKDKKLYNTYYKDKETADKILFNNSYLKEKKYKKLRREFLLKDLEHRRKENKKKIENKKIIKNELSKEEKSKLTKRYDTETEKKSFRDIYQPISGIKKDDFIKLGHSIFLFNKSAIKGLDLLTLETKFLNGSNITKQISIKDIPKIGNIYYIDISNKKLYPNILKIDNIKYKRNIIGKQNFYGNKELINEVRHLLLDNNNNNLKEENNIKKETVNNVVDIKKDEGKDNTLFLYIIGIMSIFGIISISLFIIKRKRKKREK